MATPIFDAIPEELKTRNQWVLWRQVNRAGKLTKVPYQPNGTEADSSDPSTWCAYAEAVKAYNKGGFDGTGFVFDPLDPYAGVDLDRCISADGTIKPKAKAILDKLSSDSEISPSETGVKIFLKAKLPVSVRKNDGKFQQGFESKKPDLEIEIYYGYRFFTVTGNRLTDYPATIEDRNQELTEIFKEVFKDRHYFDGESELAQSTDEAAGEPLSSDAAERLQDLFSADPTFKADLYTPAPIGKRSDAEFHLCARLWEAAFSESEIYVIMTSSPQAKWAERGDDYRRETIRKAVATSDANRKKKVEEKATKESAKKAEPIGLKDVADIEYDEDGKIKKVRFSPTFAASAILEKMPLAMTENSDEIYRFNGQIYWPDGVRKVDMALCSAATDYITGENLRETLRRVKNELLDRPVIFDPDPYLLGVKNGVAYLLTGDVREYKPEDLIQDQIPVSFDPAARCPVFLAFLESITPNISDRITLIDWFVATAIKEPLAYVLFLLGLGRNGKGIYEKLIKKFFGQAAFRDMPLTEVNKNNFAASGFYRKRGWIASETGKKKAAIGTDFIKLTSGNGVIDGDRKNKSRIQFEPYFQTIVDTNTMPKIEDSSIGWIERFVKADLPYIFVANPIEDNPLEKKRDPALFEKLSTEDELSGILNLLLFRSKAIGKSKTIHKRAGAEMFAEYAEQSSSVATFLDLFCEFDGALSNLWTPSEAIYESYRKWCEYKVGEVVDIRYFGKQLKKFCGGFDPKRGKDKDRKNTTLYKGLIFDNDKCKAALEALQLSLSQSCLSVPQSNLNEGEESQSQKITVSQLSQSNLWNGIQEKFGQPSPRKESQNSPGKGKENFIETIETIETTISSEPVEEKPNRDKTETLIETKTIEADLQRAEKKAEQKEEHFKTPSKIRWTEDQPQPEKDCGSCPVALKGDKSAIKCDPCIYLGRAEA